VCFHADRIGIHAGQLADADRLGPCGHRRPGRPGIGVSGIFAVVTSLFISAAARGRLVGVAMDRTGALLVADDIGNNVWRSAMPPRYHRPLDHRPAQVRRERKSLPPRTRRKGRQQCAPLPADQDFFYRHARTLR
jgi:hypothetical protein